MGGEFTITRSDGIRIHHEKKSDRVGVHHEKDQWVESSP